MKYVPIGKDEFKKVIDGKYYYVDKSMLIKDIRGKVVIIECKHAKSEDELVEESEKAVKQIEEKGYMKKKAYQRYGGVIGYGISFYKKQCYVIMSEKSL